VLATLVDTVGPTLFRHSILKHAIADVSLDAKIFKGKSSYIRYRVVGNKGPTLVICPDPPVMIEHYDQLARQLVKNGYRVIIFEMPGFGYSLPKLGFNFRLDGITLDIVRLLKELAMGPHFLMFPCVPGFVAINLADRFPDMIAGLVLVQIPNQQQALNWRHSRDPKGILQTPVVGQALLQMVKKKRIKDWYATALGDQGLLDRFTTPSTKALNHGACFCLASGFQRLFNELPDWQPIDKPTLIIWGSKDSTHEHTDKQSTHDLVCNASYVEMEGSGHFPDLEESEKMVELLNQFIF